jgi:CheY-like chemotaxis protein
VSFDVVKIPVVIVLDDDALSRHVLTRRLLRWGFDPETYANVSEALDRLHHDPADALVVDVDIPGIDSVELVREALVRRPGLPVYLLAPSPRPELWDRAAAVGARDPLVQQAGGADALRRTLVSSLLSEDIPRDDVALAHSLRTPLAALKGALDVLCSGRAGELPESQMRFAGIARRNADRMISLVEELLESAARA